MRLTGGHAFESVKGRKSYGCGINSNMEKLISMVKGTKPYFYSILNGVIEGPPRVVLKDVDNDNVGLTQEYSGSVLKALVSADLGPTQKR